MKLMFDARHRMAVRGGTRLQSCHSIGGGRKSKGSKVWPLEKSEAILGHMRPCLKKKGRRGREVAQSVKKPAAEPDRWPTRWEASQLSQLAHTPPHPHHLIHTLHDKNVKRRAYLGHICLLVSLEDQGTM